MSKSREVGLTINFLSFSLPIELIKDNDEIEIALMTYPDDKSQTHAILAKNRYYIHHYFQINISDETEQIIFIISKRGFFRNSKTILATSWISPKMVLAPPSNKDNNNRNSKEVLNFNLYGRIDANKSFFPFGKRNNYTYVDLAHDQRLLGSLQITAIQTESFGFKAANSNAELQETYDVKNQQSGEFQDIIICE